MIIGIVGLIGAGKDTVAQIIMDLVEDETNVYKDSFATTLKDITASVFGWDRALLEGDTEESRAFRETVDTYWSVKLDRLNLTPRWVLQYMGTEVMRNNLHHNIWLSTVENRLRHRGENDITVISDARFPNELNMIKNHGGKIIEVKRGELPEWFPAALDGKSECFEEGGKFAHVHASERSWVGHPGIDVRIENDGTMDQLQHKVKQQLQYWGMLGQ